MCDEFDDVFQEIDTSACGETFGKIISLFSAEQLNATKAALSEDEEFMMASGLGADAIMSMDMEKLLTNHYVIMCDFYGCESLLDYLHSYLRHIIGEVTGATFNSKFELVDY